MSQDIPWLTVYGFGAHIKSTQKKLIILNKGVEAEYPLEAVRHLLVIGGHTLNSTTISHLIRNGAYLSFFEPDGTPVGTIRPFGGMNPGEQITLQQTIPRHRYAIMIAESALRSRLLALHRLEEKNERTLFYEGESQFLHKSLEELEYLIKLDEIRRLSRLSSDMYYEILSRDLPEKFGYRRRSAPPHCDVVNAMMSFGYAMLFGNCCISIIGANLDPDIGMLHEGHGALVYDLMEPFKAEMIDPVVCRFAQDEIGPDDFELTPTRCMLSDDLAKRLIVVFQNTLDRNKIDKQVDNFSKSIRKTEEFKVMY
ncbi:MAG: CRISPR-associated endonuclease Cas1 [Methanoregula sp.]